MSDKGPARRSAKAEQTRAAIVGAALDLFKAGGYDATTMRAIADQAGVSLGSAYYYFAGKEELVQAFYDQLQTAHAAAAGSAYDSTEFAERLRRVMESFLDVAEPFHEFGGQFFRNAADPRSPLSPFSPESAPAREASTELFRRAVEGSDLKVAPALRAELPDLLWLLHMGVVLFWVYDDSPGQRRTRTLVAGVVPLVDRSVRLTRLPLVRGLVDDALGVVRQLRGA
ncbi:TetR/AcrR family transcriptional regulator [Nocardioides oleivorans]|uniref:TetR/AcrR family transcriptional regulator n=1 Tax=Nocardioides oleivorans TaxID=273676 RepID=A0A4Q2RZU6_9ACTN|nr:TetR family transcriptional regulator [Nocardioides oleivorans]RYB93595.1 TetR/AcrR family transcriptional regulator [Nocardioides oleivorans]